MNGQLKTLNVPFPLRLMSSSRTPTSMPMEYGREVRNMYALQAGAGRKRSGVVKSSNLIENENIVQLMHHVTISGDVQILAGTDAGKLYLLENNIWSLKKTGLNPEGKIRWAHFSGKLIVCNGMDNLLSWNGADFEDVSEWVKDLGENLTYIDEDSFTIESDEELYPIGRPLKLYLNGVDVFANVLSTSKSGDVITVNLDSSVLTSALSDVFVEMKPPKFQYIYAAHDRLWGCGTGKLTSGFGASVERSFVYYTKGVNDETAWHDEAATLQYINFADKMSTSDELVAMAVKDNLTAFFFKEHVQIWRGYDPTLSGDFTWDKTIPLGAVHGDLVVEMPNDIGFFTRFGVRTISRLLQTEQLDVGDLGSEVDSSVSDAVQNMLSSDENMKNVHSFRHDRQGWFAFKPYDETFVFQIGQSHAGWSVFDGIYAHATAFLNMPNGELYMAQGGQLYQYDENVFSDDGESIFTRWWTPWLTTNSYGKRWANKYVEVISEQQASVDIELKRFKSYNSSSYSENRLTLMTASDYWETSHWDDGFFDNGSPRPQKMRDHFVADTFAYALESNSIEGPFTIFGLKLYGIQEK